MKYCFMCKQEKGVSCFYTDKNRKGGISNKCKDCEKKGKKKYYIKNRESIIKKEQKRYVENPERKKNEKLRRAYGISLNLYNDILEKQKGCCAICRKPDPSGKMLAVDHNHDTNEIRGLLCTKCNPLLGYAGDSVDILKKAIGYLETAKDLRLIVANL